MIYEIRTYDIKPGSLAEVEKRFAEAYEHRKKRSPLAAFWHTEIGPLNQIIHVWPYKDLAERDRIRAEAVKDKTWSPRKRAARAFPTSRRKTRSSCRRNSRPCSKPICQQTGCGAAHPIQDQRRRARIERPITQSLSLSDRKSSASVKCVMRWR